jgi:adenylate cyclase
LPKPRVKRRLAAILAADVVGYSHYISVDEIGALTRLAALRSNIIEPAITRYSGRLFKTMGDGYLVEFSSVVQAVNCAIAIQTQNEKTKAAFVDSSNMQLRIGIHVGDVVVEQEDLLGEGVNIAARLEGIAETGGISISRTVYDHVRDRVNVDFVDKGEKVLKNIPRPVQVFAIAGLNKSASEATEFKPTIEFPDKPSIAVLPFTNMSGDPEQEYFSDGITEDIITELSRFQSLFVIARNSSFTYKGQAVDVKRVGRELGVHYVVEGSVRKAGQRVRITAQLVDTVNGNHNWAERYDRELEDIFAVQDEVAQTIVSVLPGRLDHAAFESAKRKPTENLTAYDYVLRGIEIFKHMTREDCTKASQMFSKAIELDPEYARAHTLLANTYVWSVFMEWSTKEVLDKAMECCEVALTFDDEDSRAHSAIGFVLFLRKQDEESENHFQRAMMLNPNDPDIAAFRADVLVYLGRWKEALELINTARRLNPFYPEYYDWYRALVLYSAHQYEQAVKAIKEIMNLDRWHHAYLAACLGQLGRFEEAQQEATMFINIREKELKERGESVPASALDLALERADRYRNQDDREHFLDGLRKAGFPD